MCSEVSITKADEKEKFNHLPNYQIINKTYWFRWLIIFLVTALGAIIAFQFIVIEVSRILVILIYILDGFLLFFTLIFGFFYKKTFRTFIIEENNPLTQGSNNNHLIYRFHMRKIKISSKSFQLNEIKRFEVIQHNRGNSLQWYCALVFNTGKYLTITTTLDAPLTFHYAKKLNEFLASNTSLDKRVLEGGLIPYIPIKEQKRIKYIKSLRLIFILVVAIFLILLIILFSIANFELIPTIVIMFFGVFMGILLIMALNGATLDGM